VQAGTLPMAPQVLEALQGTRTHFSLAQSDEIPFGFREKDDVNGLTAARSYLTISIGLIEKYYS
jgi:hypothetical protein